MCDWNMVNANNEVVGTIFNVETEYEANCMASKLNSSWSAKPISTEPTHRNKNVNDIPLSLGTDSFHCTETFSDIAHFVDRVREANYGLSDDEIYMIFDEKYSDHEMVTVTVPKSIDL